MFVPGILHPCHHPRAMLGSARMPATCCKGISSELLNAHSLSAPRTLTSRFPPEMDRSTMQPSACYPIISPLNLMLPPKSIHHPVRTSRTLHSLPATAKEWDAHYRATSISPLLWDA